MIFLQKGKNTSLNRGILVKYIYFLCVVQLGNNRYQVHSHKLKKDPLMESFYFYSTRVFLSTSAELANSARSSSFNFNSITSLTPLRVTIAGTLI